MKVILRSNVAKIGKKGDVKDVSDGYATNFLIPRDLAEQATPTKIKEAVILMKEQSVHQEVQQQLLEKNLNALKDISVEIIEKANEQGHLYEGVHKEAIIKALQEQAHVVLNDEHIVLEHPIKVVGEQSIVVHANGKESSFRLHI